MKVIFLNILFATAKLLSAADSQINPSACGEQGDCLSSPADCQDKCGCDRSVVYYYNSTLDECLVDLKHLLSTLIQKHYIEEVIHNEADKVFGRLMVSAFFFLLCVFIVCVMACIYCVRINYSDYYLEKQVRALTKNLKSSQRHTKIPVSPRLSTIGESCNVIVEDSNLFVV